MKFVVPESLGSDLRVLPPDTYEAEVQDVLFGTSASGNPKATVKLIVQSEYTGKKEKDFQSCVGETVLESISLQSQAMWKLNDWYKGATGERIPEGEFDEEEFKSMIKEALVGSRWNILLKTDTSQGDERTKVDKASAIKGKGKKVRR